MAGKNGREGERAAETEGTANPDQQPVPNRGWTVRSLTLGLIGIVGGIALFWIGIDRGLGAGAYTAGVFLVLGGLLQLYIVRRSIRDVRSD